MENVASGKYQRAEEKHNSFLFSHRGKLKLCFPIKKSQVGNNLSLIGFIFLWKFIRTKAIIDWAFAS